VRSGGRRRTTTTLVVHNVLKQVADAINSTFRQSDVLARIGAARFCALLPEKAGHAGESAAARLQTAIRAWNMEPGIPFQLDVVASGARFDPASPISLDALMGRAETAVNTMRAVRVGKWPAEGQA